MINLLRSLVFCCRIISPVFFLGCSSTTYLLNETNDYEPVIHEKAKLKAMFLNENVANPNFKIKVERGIFAIKVYKKFYVTEGKKNESLGWGIALTSLSAVLIVLGSSSNGWEDFYNETVEHQNYTAGSIEILSGILIGTVGIALLFNNTVYSNRFSKESADTADTKYLFNPATDLLLSVESTNSGVKYLHTDNGGIIELDIREYLGTNNYSRDVAFNISYLSSDSCEVIIPKTYINTIIKNEEIANDLEAEGEREILNKNNFIAYSIYKKIQDEYSYTKASSIAIRKLPSIINDLNNELTQNLNSVSTKKVQDAVDEVITSSELEDLGNKVKNMSTSQIARVMINGLGFIMDNYTAVTKFNKLSKEQKMYAIIASSEKLGGSKTSQLSELLDINESLAVKLSRINSKDLLE